MLFSAPKIVGECIFVNSTRDSLTFTWQSATSATSYRLVGDRVNITSEHNTITVDGLTPGSRYTFIVSAVDAHGLTSNNITCINSTGVLFISINKRNSFSSMLFEVSCYVMSTWVHKLFFLIKALKLIQAVLEKINRLHLLVIRLLKVVDVFLPRCMECQRGLATRKLSVCPSVYL